MVMMLHLFSLSSHSRASPFLKFWGVAWLYMSMYTSDSPLNMTYWITNRNPAQWIPYTFSPMRQENSWMNLLLDDQKYCFQYLELYTNISVVLKLIYIKVHNILIHLHQSIWMRWAICTQNYHSVPVFMVIFTKSSDKKTTTTVAYSR